MKEDLTRDHYTTKGYKYIKCDTITGIDLLARRDDYNGIIDVLEYVIFKDERNIRSGWIEVKDFLLYEECAKKLGITQ